MATRTALVIGGTGFISTFVVEALLDEHFEVTLLNRGHTADHYGDRVKRMRVDTSERKKFVAALKLHRFDLVLDAICFDGKHAEDVVKGLHDNCGLYIMISTDSVYEVCKQKDGPQKEKNTSLLDMSEKSLHKLDSYGYKKWQAEKVFRKAFKKKQFPFTAFRLPDVLGERETPSSRHYKYQKEVKNSIPIPLDKKKAGPLSFVYAPDVARATIAAYNTNIADVVGEAFNIGSVETPTLKEYLEGIGDILGVTPVFEWVRRGGNNYLPSVEGGPCSMQKALDTLNGWEPTPFATWLRTTVEWYEANADCMDSTTSTTYTSSTYSSEE